MKIFPRILLYLILLVLVACTATRPLAKTGTEALAQEPDLRSAHVGICVYDPASSVYLYNYQADKYFVPASNTKLFSLYAGLKCLGDSLPGIGYIENDTAILLVPTGDPSLLHPDYTSQPVIDFLKNNKKLGINITKRKA